MRLLEISSLATVGVLLAALPLSHSQAAPPPNTDMSLAPWFNSLQQPGSGISCCSVADCRRTDSRYAGDHYEAFVDEQWRAVPPGAVVERQDNPTGHAVVCYTPARGIMCFIKAPDS